MFLITDFLDYLDNTQNLTVLLFGSLFIAPVLATVAGFIA